MNGVPDQGLYPGLTSDLLSHSFLSISNTVSCRPPRPHPSRLAARGAPMHHHLSPRRTHWLIVLAGIVTMVVAVVAGFTGSGLRPASAATDRAAARPIMGWSSWSFYRGPGNQAQILAQAAAMHANLQSHGYVYVNLDAGWSDHVDNYGRDVWDRSLFPMGIPALAATLHGMGLKFGLYLNPGIRQEVVSANRPILGTHFHAKDIADTKHIGNTTGCCYRRIDFSQPGAHEDIQSYVDLFTSWGVDYAKMDFVGPGGGNAPADNRPDMQAWNQAIVHNGRPIVLELSNSLSFANASTWQKYANGWQLD